MSRSRFPTDRPTAARLMLVALVLPLLLLAGACSLKTPGLPRIPRQPVQTHQLPNGLTVYLLESRTTPLVTIDAWVRVGSKDEPPALAGISHFLEHMLFKGTQRLAVGEYDLRIEEIGGYLNAATSQDYTHYYVSVPSNHLERALGDLVDVLLNSVLPEDEVANERTVILEEIRQKQDSPVAFLYDEVTRALFAEGPYAGTVIGTAETVSSMSREDLLSHYHRFYAPSNMALILVGDFDSAAILDKIKTLFHAFDRELNPWLDQTPATVYQAPAQREWQRDWRETYFFLAAPGPAVPTIEDMAAIEVAEALLSGGRTARLINRLREKDRVVTSISGFFHANLHPNFLAIYGTCDPERLDIVRESIFREIEELKSRGPSREELARARRQAVTAHVYATETNTGKASLLGYSYALFGSPDLLNEYPRAIGRVSAKDVQDVLRAIAPDQSSWFVARPPAPLTAGTLP